jgi:PLP dependent protein
VELRSRIEQVNKRISAACERVGRSPEDVRVIAVTKYVGPEVTEAVLDAGLTDIGENRWQDAKEKWERLGDRGTWHFIGHLQTNKARDVVGKFGYIHSLDRLSLAQEIEKAAAKLEIRQKCLIQVNISGEESKFGLPPEQAAEFVREVSGMPHIEIAGFMAMAPLEHAPEATRPVFRGLRELRDKLNAQHAAPYEIRGLSMGMSGDFEVAVEEGATWVRLGSILVK